MRYIGSPYGGNHLYNIRTSDSVSVSEEVIEIVDDAELAKYDPTSISDLQLRSVGGYEKKIFDCSMYSNLRKLHIIANVGKLILPASLEELRLDSSYVGMDCVLDLSICKNLKAFSTERGITRLLVSPSLTYLKLGYTSGHESTIERLEHCTSLTQLDVDWKDWHIDIPNILKFLDISGDEEFDLLDLSHCSQLRILNVAIKKLKKLILPMERPDEYRYSIQNNAPFHSCGEIEGKCGDISNICGEIIISKYIK